MLAIEKIIVTDSSVIKMVAYDSTFCHLFITFTSGKVYRYISVEKSAFEKVKETIQNEESVGKFYNKNIKGQYDCALIN